MYTPKISIIIPAYNASNYLGEAIDSALAQTYTNTEIIVVNDGSTDDDSTERLALSYGGRIRYYSQENGGSSSALNLGIAHMTGEWFSWLSHDDLYVPQKLEQQLRYMESLNIPTEQLPDHIFFSASEFINAKGKTLRYPREAQSLAMEQKLRTIPHNGYLIAEPTVHNFHGCSCLIHKNVFAREGGFDENLRLINDLDFWFRLYKAEYTIHFQPQPLVKGRLHEQQVSRSIGFSYHNAEQDMYWRRSLDWLLEHYPQDGKLFFRFGRNAYLKTRNDDGDRAFAHLKTLASCTPMLPMYKVLYKSRASVWSAGKYLYLKLKL